MRTLSRRDCLAGAIAVSAGAVGRSSAAGASGALTFKGELSIVTLQASPPDRGLQDIIKTFEAAHPGITVRQTTYPSERFVALLTATLSAGEPVDLLLQNGQDLRRYASDGTITSLGGLVGDTSRFAPAALDTCRIKSRLWAVPYGDYSGFPIFYNRAVLEKYKLSEPKRYADFLPIRDRLRSEGVSTFVHPGKVIYLWPVWFFTAFEQTSANRSVQRMAQILAGRGKFTDADVVSALDLVFRFGKDNLVPRSVFGLDLPGATASFSTGRSAFFMAHSGLIREIVSAKPAGVELDVMLMPRLTETDVQPQFPGGPGVVVSLPAKVTGDRKEAAIALLMALTSDRGNEIAIVEGFGTVPCNRGVATSSTPPIPKLVGLSRNLATYLDWSWPPEITEFFQQSIQAGMAGYATADAVARKAQTRLEQLASSGRSAAE